MCIRDRIETAPQSRLRATLGGPSLEVNTFHHQAVQTLGKGLVATAWAKDGTIEAVENPGERMVMGVQWHAEGLREHGPLFELLIAAAAAEEPVAEPRRLDSARGRHTRSRRQPSAQFATAG